LETRIMFPLKSWILIKKPGKNGSQEIFIRKAGKQEEK
jgi:hypothetical protein